MLTNIRNWINAISFAVIVVVNLPSKGIYGKNVTIHEVNPDDWVQECATVYQDNCCNWDKGNISYYVNYSAYDIIEKPSGLCKPEFSCAWSGCIPNNYQSLTETTGAFVSDFLSVDIDANTTYSDIESVLGPGLNLPEKITFPTGPSDIIEAIQHAKEEGLTVSIMSTGHSYTGASTNSGSVQLNLRGYPKYSKSSIVECGDNSDAQGAAIARNVATHPDNAPACKLATARGKKAFVRVGGGEIFNDVASSVFALKDNNTGYSKYMMLHGVGTVGAAGGWLQGGGLGWGQERVWGLGVDQVLEIEMVLADERHVKFYPTEWEDVKGFMYPKTKKVEGLCNTNVFADEESMWVWEPCNDPVPPFEDLWFAVRGGGGGTYGVLTSVNLQLHDNIPFYGLAFDDSRTANDEAKLDNYTQEEIADISGKLVYCRTNFALDFLFNPETINVTKNTSNHCGSPAIWFPVPNMFCLGKDAADAAKDSYDKSMTSCANEVFPEYLDILPDVLEQFYIDGPHDSLISFQNTDGGLNVDVPGQLVDDGPSILPQVVPYSGWSSAQVPESWLASKNDDVIETFVFNQAWGSHVTGGNVAIAHDQMNAVPLPERQSGLASAGFGYLPLDLQERLLTTFLNETISTGKSFPGITEFNHIASYSYGPLKSDMTKICPDDFNTEEKEEKCFSMQESVWGVELTAKLEGIKYAVDPKHLFYCYGCIEPKEHNLTKDAATNVPVSSPTELPSKGVQSQVTAVEDLDSASPTFLLRTLVTFLMGGTMVLISIPLLL